MPMKSLLMMLCFLPCLLRAQNSSLEVYFASGKDSLSAEERIRFDEWCATAKARNLVPMNLTGYADSVGKPAYNLALSQRRVEGVARLLLLHYPSLTADSLSVQFRGEVPASQQNLTEEARQHNRRVTITFAERKPRVKPLVFTKGCNELVIWPGDFEGDLNDIDFTVNFVNNEGEMVSTSLGGTDENGWPLTSGGMVELTAMRNGKPVKQLKPLQVAFAVPPGTPEMSVWSGVPQGQVVSWRNTGGQCTTPGSGSYYTTLTPSQCPDRLVAAIGEGGGRCNCDLPKGCKSCRFGFWTVNMTAKMKFANRASRNESNLRIGQFNETDTLPLWSGTSRQVRGVDTLIAAQLLNWRKNSSKDWLLAEGLYDFNGDPARAPEDSLSWIQTTMAGKFCDPHLMLRGNATATGLPAWIPDAIPASPCELDIALLYHAPVADWALIGAPYVGISDVKKVVLPRKWKLEATFWSKGGSALSGMVKDAVLPRELDKANYLFAVVRKGKTYFVKGKRKNIKARKERYKLTGRFLRRNKGEAIDISAMMPK